MPTLEQVPSIIADVENRLREAADHGDHLHVSGNSLDDEWLYIVVSPAETGVRASDHARLMSQIERDLRNSGYDDVLLVPTLEE